MDNSLDQKFKTIQTQKWLPFIGNSYLSLPKNNMLLIVGESHYHNSTEESIKKHNSKDYTKLVIEELAIKRWYWGTKIFQNFHKAMFGNDVFNSETFWNLTSFYNFIQRPMETNKSRPTFNDFFNGWITFFDTIDITKPKTCIFIGTEASNSLRHAISDSNFSLKSLNKDGRISRTYPRRAIILDNENNEIELIFIQHTSQYFSWKKWNEYLNYKIPHQIEWFEEKIKEKNR